MAEADRTLGGFDPRAGRNTHAADEPQRIPVPSLLRTLLSDHLDPGYAAAAAEREKRDRPPHRWVGWVWQAAAALLVTAVFAAAVAQARSVAPKVTEAQRVLAANVYAAQASTDALAVQRNQLSAEVNGLRRAQLAGDARGRQLLSDLDGVSFAAADTPVHGQGLLVTLADPSTSNDLTDVSKIRLPGSRQVVLDRDLQLVVNALWASGAEAVAIDDVRIGPNVTIRQAGGAILVDNRPVTSPYEVVAIGPPQSMQTAFTQSSALHRMRLLETSYGAGVTVSVADDLTAPAAGARDIRYAKGIGG